MRWYGSLQNRIEEVTRNPKPTVGMGATELMYSDRNAWEIVAVKDDRHITVRRMKAKCKNWFAGDWEVEPDEKGYTTELFLTKKGQWRQRYGKRLGNVFRIGYADEYRDPEF